MSSQTVFSVTQINEYVKMTLESNPVLRSVFIRGEISNLKSNYSSGHIYFSLKDEDSSIRAVMFRSSAVKMKFRAESGMRVIAHGRISAYTVSGDCQIIVDDMQPDGAGALAIAFEQLKKRLGAEGLFDEDRKKPIPTFAKRVGVVTSASGAALHDIINVSGRRCPSTEIIIYPSYVQGELAPRSLCGGIAFFNQRCAVDLIIIGRGGGSAEDLWCFNDEGLARAIAASSVPVISAVGHETDFTICDFVADMRAPTPSAAAELAFPDARELINRVSYMKRRCDGAILQRVNTLQGAVEVLCKDVERLSPERVLNERTARLDGLREKLGALARRHCDSAEKSFYAMAAKLDALDPLAVLSHGYSAVEDNDGRIVGSVDDVEVGESVRIRLSDGVMNATVTQKIPDNSKGGN
jgi:exodeoxyribonuclease VII large subunit